MSIHFPVRHAVHQKSGQAWCTVTVLQCVHWRVFTSSSPLIKKTFLFTQRDPFTILCYPSHSNHLMFNLHSEVLNPTCTEHPGFQSALQSSMLDDYLFRNVFKLETTCWFDHWQTFIGNPRLCAERVTGSLVGCRRSGSSRLEIAGMFRVSLCTEFHSGYCTKTIMIEWSFKLINFLFKGSLQRAYSITD